MGRARQATVPQAAPPKGRGVQVSQAATDLAQLLRARAFCLSGEGASLARLVANLEASGGRVDEDAAAWVGLGTPPAGRVALSLGPSAGALGPHSFGFINNLDGVAPLAAPLSPQERPRRGHIAWVVPRRDALPEVAPLLFGRGLGVSWLISVGDGDPAEVLRFLALDPATSAILVAIGRGVRPSTLREVLGEKPAVLLEPASAVSKDSPLLRAVARRAGAVVTSQLEEWLAHAALLDAVADGGGHKSGTHKHRAVVVVSGAGVDYVSSEVQKAQPRARLPVRSVDGEDAAALDEMLRQAGRDADVVLLCGAGETVDGAAAPGPLLRVDPAQPERLRALLRTLSSPPPVHNDKPSRSKVDTARVEAVLADLPPPLYVGGAEVSDEVLGDHDVKRLLNAYGVRVSRQAPANTTTAALRILSKLELPVALLPAVEPNRDVEQIVAEESQSQVICATQAEVKRQATLLLSHNPHVMLRETLPSAPLLRLQAGPERGLGMLVKLGPAPSRSPSPIAVWEAALLPLPQDEALRLCETLLSSNTGDAPCEAKELATLLAGLSTCLETHALTLDLVVLLAKEPVVLHAAGVLKRQARRK